MADWLIEQGIGETRALLVEGGEVLAAKMLWPGELTAGETGSARLVSKISGARRGVAALETGTEVLVDHLPPQLTEGARFNLRISRAPISERGRFKRAQGRYLPENEAGSAASQTPFNTGTTMRQFPAGLWEEVWHAASSGSLEFPGGEILCSVTPAMTVIDVDGDAPPRELALAAVPAISKALRWFDLGGSIAIDFPTLESKADRRAVDEALADALGEWPHERTAMNGFGFVQLVARLDGPSLLHRFATSRVGLCARAALRAGERVEGAGAVLLTVHPALKAKLKPRWIEELARRSGKEVRIETDPGLALEAPHAQVVSHV
ncbi:MAG: ribonuclease E/G [Pseudomonadota bacterium]